VPAASGNNATYSKGLPPPEPIVRQERTVLVSIFYVFPTHEIRNELEAVSHWLDDHRALLDLVAADLANLRLKATRRQARPAEDVELAFHLEDSAAFRAFARLTGLQKSVLQKMVSDIQPETWGTGQSGHAVAASITSRTTSRPRSSPTPRSLPPLKHT